MKKSFIFLRGGKREEGRGKREEGRGSRGRKSEADNLWMLVEFENT
jgi:hypothetical protein